MQNAGLQYVEGVTPLPESPFGVTQMQNNNTSSSTSSLRQFRKKDNVDKSPGAAGAHSASISRADSLSSSHVARVAPHNHYPPKQNEYFRYPSYQEYGSPYKEHTVKYSEIAEPVPQAIPHLEHLPPSVLSKHKEKDFAEMCNIPQQPHLNKPFSDHQFNGQQGYPTEMALHHQYMQKEPQGPQMHSPYKPESQYIPKEGTFNHQISPFLKYNIPPQSRNYSHLENTSLGSFQRMDSHIARSLMSDHPHIRDFPADYGAMEQGRMYTQKQRYYSAPMPPSNPSYTPNYPHRNIPTQQYNYPNCNYTRTAQVNPSMSRYPINMDRSISPRRSYAENLDIGMNYTSVPQKISSAYPNYPAYAQHYQHRRPPAAPQEYYHHQQHPHTRSHPQYMPTHHPQEVGENHVASNNIRQYLENWAEEESTTEISPQMENPKYIPRMNRDEANEVYVINASELPQYLENGVPLVTSENGQYIFKSNVSIDNTGAIKILEKTVDNAVLPTDAQERVVSLHIIENPKADCLINTRTNNINQEHVGSGNQVPAATINVITSNTSHSNQEHTVQQSYNLATPAFNANNRMNSMHHVPPINQSGPQHNQNFENSVDLCLHNNMPVENNSPQESILSNSTPLDDAIRLSPQIQPVEKSSELCQKLQNDAVSDENLLGKNRLKIQVLSYQEVPQNSCIVMPSTQSRLNFDESLLPNQVPSDAKGTKNDFGARNDHDESSGISSSITNNDNILNEAHEELDKIVEDTLTSSNINIPLVSCERNDLPKIQDKYDSANSRIPDDLNLDLESNPKDSSNNGSDYTIENGCNNQNEDIIDLSTSRRGSSNDSEEQSIKLDISGSSEHNKLEQIVQEAQNNISILNEFASSNNENLSTDIKAKNEDGALSKSSMKHMPLIEENPETRSSTVPSEYLVTPDIMIEQKNPSDEGITIDQCKEKKIGTENIDLEKKQSEDIDMSLVADIPTTHSEISDTTIVKDLPQSENTRDDQRTISIDISLEAKLSEIVGEPYESSDTSSYNESTDIQIEEKQKDEDTLENIENRTKTEPDEINLNPSLGELSSKNTDLILESDVILKEEPAVIIQNMDENPPQMISEDSSLKKAKEGSRKRRIFSVDDIIYRIGPTTVQNRRDSMHSIPDSDCTNDIFLEESKPQDNSLQISKEVSDSNFIGKKEKSFESLESAEKILMDCEKSEYDIDSCKIETSKKLKAMNAIIESKSNLENKRSDNVPLIPTFNESIEPCSENISKDDTAVNIHSEEKKFTKLESKNLVEAVKYSGPEKMIANIDTSEKNGVVEECSTELSTEENKEIETIRIVESVEIEVRTYLVAPETVISMDRTSEFLASLKAHYPKQDTVKITDFEKVDNNSEKLPLIEQPHSEKLDTLRSHEKVSDVKGIYIYKEVDDVSERISIHHKKSDEIELSVSEQSDVNVDNSTMDCTEIENDVQSCNALETAVAPEFCNVEMEDQSTTVHLNSIENTNDKSEKTPLDTTDTSSDFKMKHDVVNCYKTEDVTEKSLQTVNALSGCRFSVIHKIDDIKRITHQEEIGFAENCDTNNSKIIDIKQKIDTLQISEQKTDDLKLSTDKLMSNKEYMSNETIEKSDSTTPNHCSVIQSIECTMQQNGLKDKIIETFQEETEENPKIMKDIGEFVHNSNETSSNDENISLMVLKSDAVATESDNVSDNDSPMLKTRGCEEETSETAEKLKSSILLKKEELTFEQKFVNPFCDKIEQNSEKIDEIDQKPPEEVQYRSVLKIEENNVLLEICGELVEIIVNHVNGRKVITVIPMSSSATVDFNDNYEHVDRSQLNEENEDINLIDDDRKSNEENQKEMPGVQGKFLGEYRNENTNNEKMSEYTKIFRSSEEDRINNGCEFISSTLSENIGEIFEDVILNENEIIIGDESLEEEVNLDLQSKGVLEDEGSTLKPTLCTKASKKLYDDIALQMPSKTYSSLREFRRIKSKPESSTIDYNKNSKQSNGKRSSKRSVRVSSRKKGVSEQNEVSQTALRELIERRKMRKEKIRLKYAQYAKQESKILPELIKTNNLSGGNDGKNVSTVFVNETQIQRSPSTSDVKKGRPNDEMNDKRLKQKMIQYNAKIVKKSVQRKSKMSDQDYSRELKQQILPNVEIEKKKAEEKPTSTSVIVSSSISTLDALPKNFHEVGTSTAKEISKNQSSQEKSTKFPRIPTPRDLSLTKNVNEHYLSRKDHSNLKKKLSIQEYNSRKRKAVDCKTSVPKKCLKSTDEVASNSKEDHIGEVVKPSTIYSDRQFECFPNSVKDPRRRPHIVNVQSTKLQRSQSEYINKSQSISSSRIYKQNENSLSTNSKKLKDPLLNSNESSVEEVQSQKNYRTLLGKLSLDTFTPKATKISSRRKTVEVMYDRNFETTETTRKKVSFDDNVQINEINTTQSRTTSIKPETTNDCEVSSSCSDIVEDKTSEDRTHSIKESSEELNKDLRTVQTKSDEERKNDWESSNSPEDSITDVFAASFLEKSKIESLKNKSKVKCIIDMSDFETSLVNNELKSPYRVCLNSNSSIYEDAGSLKDYKEAVDSKLNSLSIQIPKSPKTKIVNEDDVLIHKFLRKEQLNPEEIKQIRRIIYLKKKIQQMAHQNTNTKSDNESYEVKKKFESSSQKGLKLQLKKIDGRPRKKKKRFRNLYSNSPETSENEVQETAGEFSVYEDENMSGVKLIFRRKTELMHLQPVVKLQRCKYIECMAKKLKYE